MILLPLGACQTTPNAFVDPVTIEGGLVAGVELPESDVRVYKGIPFAAPPVGEFRWRPPQPISLWDGVWNAETYSYGCMQALTRSRLPWTEPYMHQGDVSEDCLYLNVWTAASRSDEKRPVMVWIYGGGFQEGSTSVATYDGTEFAERGVVLVSINYRLGLLGFLAHAELTEESPEGSSGNYGYLDQIAALKWVQANIAAFGGDPDNVTIFGQSAGAMSVRVLMQSPLAEGLFARGILQSGAESLPPGFLRAGMSLSAAESVAVQIQDDLGADSLPALRALPAESFLIPSPMPLSVVEDGWVITSAGESQVQIPVVAGMVANDWMWGIDPAMTTEAYSDYAEDTFGSQAESYVSLYPAASDADVMAAREEAIRDRGRVALFDWASEAGIGVAPIYTYYFDRAIPWPEHPEFGAFHSVEIPYVFNTMDELDRPWEDVDHRVANQMISYWVNFARTGNPNGNDLPDWALFDPAASQTMRLGANPAPMPVATAEKIEFWRAEFAAASE